MTTVEQVRAAFARAGKYGSRPLANLPFLNGALRPTGFPEPDGLDFARLGIDKNSDAAAYLRGAIAERNSTGKWPAWAVELGLEGAGNANEVRTAVNERLAIGPAVHV